MIKNKLSAAVAVFILLSINIVLWYLIDFFEKKPADNHSKISEKSTTTFTRWSQIDANGIASDVASGVLTGLSMPSLEMRENVDFLLTPAVIVQECINEDVIVVYPEE